MKQSICTNSGISGVAFLPTLLNRIEVLRDNLLKNHTITQKKSSYRVHPNASLTNDVVNCDNNQSSDDHFKANVIWNLSICYLSSLKHLINPIKINFSLFEMLFADIGYLNLCFECYPLLIDV